MTSKVRTYTYSAITHLVLKSVRSRQAAYGGTCKLITSLAKCFLDKCVVFHTVCGRYVCT